jgi:hypothetical protein
VAHIFIKKIKIKIIIDYNGLVFIFAHPIEYSTTPFLIVPVVYLGLFLDERVWFCFSSLTRKESEQIVGYCFFCLLG